MAKKNKNNGMPFSGVQCDAKECKIWWVQSHLGKTYTVEIKIPTHVARRSLRMSIYDNLETKLEDMLSNSEAVCD